MYNKFNEFPIIKNLDAEVDYEVITLKEQAYKVCATCINFEATKTKCGMQYRCKRLGFDTKPSYSFNCWNPKDHVLKLMKKRIKEEL